MSVKKVSLSTANRTPKSLGSGLGQQTGGDEFSDSLEARRILSMMERIQLDQIEEDVSVAAAAMVHRLRKQLADTNKLAVTGKILFFLRDIKDKLTDRGLI